MDKKVIKIAPILRCKEDYKYKEKRVCAYCRVSTNSNEQKNSFEAQVKYYKRLISNKQGWILTEIYADEAKSGTKIDHREQFQKMLQDCKEGKIDLILTKSVTRFARNTLDSISVIRMLKNIGVEVYFEKEKIGTFSEKSEQLLTILSSIAQCEAENISSNSKWSIRKRFQDGTYKISTPAYGYANNKNGKFTIQPEEAAIVRRIFNEYLKGKGSYIIAKELQSEGIPTIRGSKKWRAGVIKGILQNPIYEGDILYQKTFKTEGVPFMQKQNRGQLSMYLVKNDHKPIISRETAETVREIYEYRRKNQHAENNLKSKKYVFSGRIVCGECGNTFRRQKIYIGKSYEQVQWCCRQHIEDISKCGQKAVRENMIQEAFINLWNHLLSHYKEILMPVLSVLKAIPIDINADVKIAELENKIQELKWQSHMLRKFLSDSSMDSAIFIEKRNQLDNELEKAVRLEKNLKNKGIFKNEIIATERLISVFNNHPEIIEKFDEELFNLIIEKITVYDGKLLFRLKNGIELEEIYERKG